MKLLKKTPFFLLLITLISSCTKEQSIDSGSRNNGGQASLQGTWKFISNNGTVNEMASFNVGSDLIKIESLSTLATKNPVGLYRITATDFNGEGVGYDLFGSMSIKTFENNVLQSENSIPVDENVPPTNLNSKYKLIGSDSIYFTTNSPGSPTGESGGCRYKLEGKKLSLFMKTDTTMVTDQGGIITTEVQKINFTLILEKQ